MDLIHEGEFPSCSLIDDTATPQPLKIRRKVMGDIRIRSCSYLQWWNVLFWIEDVCSQQGHASTIQRM